MKAVAVIGVLSIMGTTGGGSFEGEVIRWWGLVYPGTNFNTLVQTTNTGRYIPMDAADYQVLNFIDQGIPLMIVEL
jgi:hypothetical protein